MKKNFVCGVAIAGFMTIGLIAQTQTQPQDQGKNMSTDRKVTVQGCLERDMSTTGTAAYKLTQVDVIKDEPASSNMAKDMARDTSTAAKDVAKGTADVATAGHYGQKDKDKDIALQVTPATTGKVDLSSQVNHKVELVGWMSTSDLDAARAKASTASTMMAPLNFKATSIKSIADKCQ